jgi:preprotein translocase subunit SecG
MLITANGAGLTVVMAAMAVLWLIATIHHSLLAKTRQPQQPASQHRPRPASAH